MRAQEIELKAVNLPTLTDGGPGAPKSMFAQNWECEYEVSAGLVTLDGTVELGQILGNDVDDGHQFIYYHQGWRVRDCYGSTKSLQEILHLMLPEGLNVGALLFNDIATLQRFLEDDCPEGAATRCAIGKIRAYPQQRMVLTFQELSDLLDNPASLPTEFPARSPVKNYLELIDRHIERELCSILDNTLGHLGSLDALRSSEPLKSLWSDFALARMMSLQDLSDIETFVRRSVHLELGSVGWDCLKLSPAAASLVSAAEEILFLPDTQFQGVPTVLRAVQDGMTPNQYIFSTSVFSPIGETITGHLLPIPTEIQEVAPPSDKFVIRYAQDQQVRKPLAVRGMPFDVFLAGK